MENQILMTMWTMTQACIERLRDVVHAAAEPVILTEMSETVPRIDMYRRRLNEALTQSPEGQ